MKYFLIALIIIGLAIGGWFLYAAKTMDTNNTDRETSSGTSPSPTPPAPSAGTVVLETSLGNIEITLNNTDAPKTAANFAKLVREGFYDNTKFHRVIANFMIQGGDPQSKDDSRKAFWGTGGPGYMFEDEIHANNHNNAGFIAMANSGPDTNGSQFFINLVDNNYLDTKHTVFGQVTAGLDIVAKIGSVSTDADDRPINPVIIKKAYVK